ncbi:hypothetical protein [Candidatus Filomicrobium marinum]|uniref:hypothetical protein n=1 Tax=Candidatus Filomicrobium marinum TaxID=1608628 RepID=UPI00062696B4|nr:hypothetical protein [Candidatus Filomicrobium marinum]
MAISLVKSSHQLLRQFVGIDKSQLGISGDDDGLALKILFCASVNVEAMRAVSAPNLGGLRLDVEIFGRSA